MTDAQASALSGEVHDRPAVSVRDELRELTRQRLLAAAQTIFETDGYHRATVGRIAERARVNRATFYHHYPDKASVFMAVWEANFRDASEYWESVDIALASKQRSEVRQAFNRGFDWYGKHGSLLRPLDEAASAEELIGRSTEGILLRMAGHMKYYLATVPEGEHRRVKLRLQLLMMQFHDVMLRLVVDQIPDIGENFTAEQVLDEMTDFWFDVLPL